MNRTSKNCQVKLLKIDLDPMKEVPTTRVSLRRISKTKTALANAKKPCLKAGTSLKISRTVEMVDQTTEAWRREQSQMLFMTALGLTPKDNWTGMVPFNLKSLAAPTPDKFRLECLEDQQPSCSTGITHTKTNPSYLDNSIENNATIPNAPSLADAVYRDDDDDKDACIVLCEIKYETISGYSSQIQIGYKTAAPAERDDNDNTYS